MVCNGDLSYTYFLNEASTEEIKKTLARLDKNIDELSESFSTVILSKKIEFDKFHACIHTLKSDAMTLCDTEINQFFEKINQISEAEYLNGIDRDAILKEFDDFRVQYDLQIEVLRISI